jgi:hypothetical protein
MDVDSPALDAPIFKGAQPDWEEDTTMQDIEIDKFNIENIEMEDPDTQSPADWNGAENESVC